MADKAPLTILCIRHAERPAAGVGGVDPQGHADERSLTPRGWQRAGAWAQLFKPALGGIARLPTPTAIFASDPGTDETRSHRPVETVSSLAAALKLDVEQRFKKGEEAKLALAIQDMAGVVLICWQHENINTIVKALDPVPTHIPTHWPGDCFNGVYHLERSEVGWSFTLIMPQMFNGDSGEAF